MGYFMSLPGEAIELRQYVKKVDEAMGAQDYDTVYYLITGSLAEAWHGFRPERLSEIANTLAEKHPDPEGFIRGLLAFAGVRNQREFTGSKILMHIGQSVEMRMQGRAGEAFDFISEKFNESGNLEPVFDTRNGLQLMLAVQTGITAMLAGKFVEALSYFALAQFHVVVPSLVCLSRDAFAKAAVLHATFGAPEEAIAALTRASQLQRSVSWLESTVDTTVAIAEALLCGGSGEESLKELRDLNLHEVGEMWPFYLIALQRASSSNNSLYEFTDRIAVLERIPFPYEKGAGFAGSVFPVMRSWLQAQRGDFKTSAWFLESGDENELIVQLQRMELENLRGRPRAAIKAADQIRVAVGEGTLRQVDIARHIGIAEAYLQLGLERETVDAIRALVEDHAAALQQVPYPLSKNLFRFAEEKGLISDHFPRRQESFTHHGGMEPIVLTDREREIVRLLATDLSRNEIAERLFVSLNTLKTHLRGVYRKFDVATREAAVLRADREGLL